MNLKNIKDRFVVVFYIHDQKKFTASDLAWRFFATVIYTAPARSVTLTLYTAFTASSVFAEYLHSSTTIYISFYYLVSAMHT